MVRSKRSVSERSSSMPRSKKNALSKASSKARSISMPFPLAGRLPHFIEQYILGYLDVKTVLSLDQALSTHQDGLRDYFLSLLVKFHSNSFDIYEYRSVSAVKWLMSRKLNVFMYNVELRDEVKCNGNPLHRLCASESEQPEIFEFLLTHSRYSFKFDELCINERVSIYSTPLFGSQTALNIACSKGYANLVRLLILIGHADVNTICSWRTALMTACEVGHLECVKILIEDGSADINKSNTANTGLTALIIAARDGHLEILKYLIEKGGNVYSTDAEGRNCLAHAVEHKHYAIFEYLAELMLPKSAAMRPITPQKGDSSSVAELVMMLDDDTSNTASLLHSNMAEAANTPVNVATSVEDTPIVLPLNTVSGSQSTLSQVSSLSSNTHVDNDIDKVMQPEISVNDTYSISGDQYALLHIATRKNDTQIFTKLLQDYSADINAKSGSLQSTVFIAAREGAMDILNMLFSEEYRHLLEEDGIDAIDVRLQTPLIAAASNKHIDACKVLIENGCDVNKVDENSRTALMAAARVGNVDIVRLLVNKKQREESKRTYEKKYLKIDSTSAEQLADMRNASSKKKKNSKKKKRGSVSTDDEPSIVINLASETSPALNTVPTPRSQNDKDKDSEKEKNGKDERAMVSENTAPNERNTTGRGRLVPPRTKDEDNSNSNTNNTAEEKNSLLTDKTAPESEASKKETEVLSLQEAQEIATMAQADSFSSKLRQSVNRKTYTPFFLKQKNIADITIRSNEGKDALLYAALGNHLDVIKVLVEEGDADVNGFDLTERVSPLIAAVNLGNKQMLEYLTDHGADLNHQDHEKCTAVLTAVQHSTLEKQGESATKRADLALEMAKYLIEKGAGVDIVDNQGNTCLISAADNGHEELCLKLLHETEASAHSKDMYNCTPLLSSCKKGLKNVIPILLARYVELDHQDDHGWTALMYATTKENIDIVNMLLAANANADCEPKEGPYQGLTALIRAAYKGYKDICRVLIEKGNANVNHQNKEGSSALSYASEGGRYEVVDLLLEHNTDVETVYYDDDRTPLLFAACNANNVRDEAKGIDHIKVIRSLLAKGANIEKRDKGGQTALIHASMEGFTEAAQCLCEANALINIFDSYKQSPLMSACRRNKVETANVLLDVGKADIDLLSPYNASPLTLAAERGHLDAVDLLLKRRIKLSTVNARHTPFSKEGEKLVDGRTALMLAICNTSPFLENRNKICLNLINYNCDLNVQDDSGLTVLMHLARRGTAIPTTYSSQIAEAMVTRRTKVLPLRQRSAESQRLLVKEKVYAYDHKLRDESGCTALYYFSEALNNTAVKMILNKVRYSSVVSINSNTNMSPLMIATKKVVYSEINELSPALECIMHLLEADCDVYQKHDDSGMTALHYACEIGSDSVAMFLLAHRFLSKCKDSGIMFPKRYDAWNGAASTDTFDSPRKGKKECSSANPKKKRKVLKYLLGHGNIGEASSSTEAVNRAEAEEQEENEVANSPSNNATSSTRSSKRKAEMELKEATETMRMMDDELVTADDSWQHLLLTDVNFPLLDVQDNQGRTPLMLAMQTRKVKLVELLVKLGASKDILDSSSRLASHYLDHTHTDANATATLSRTFFQEASPGVIMLKEKAVKARTRMLQPPAALESTEAMAIEESTNATTDSTTANVKPESVVEKKGAKRARSGSDVSDCSEVVMTGSAIGAAAHADINEAEDSNGSNAVADIFSKSAFAFVSDANTSTDVDQTEDEGKTSRKRVNWDAAGEESSKEGESKQASSLLDNDNDGINLVIDDRDSRLRALLLVSLGFDPNDTSKYNPRSHEDAQADALEQLWPPPWEDIELGFPMQFDPVAMLD